MYSFTSTVRFSECDETSTLALVPLINYLQDCSAFHTESLGVGIDYQVKHGFAWALTSWRIEIDELPRLCDPISIETFCYDMKSTHAMRNYAMYRADGTRLVAADAKCVVFSRSDGKAMRIPESELVYAEDIPRLDMGPLEKKILLAGDYTPCEPVVISEQHLDYNGHVNNAQYVLIAMEAASSVAEMGAPRALDVQYRKMAFKGDTILPKVRIEGSTVCANLVDESGASYATVRLLCSEPVVRAAETL